MENTTSLTLADVAVIYAPPFVEVLQNHPLGLIDAGAQGDIGVLWRDFAEANPGCLRAVGFEPIPEAAASLMAQPRSDRRYFPVALWNRNDRLRLHLAHVPTCSSIHPPHEALNRRLYNPGARVNNWTPRETVDVVEVDGRRLDDVVAGLEWDLDVLKVDTQGAELEILDGASKTLRGLFAVLLETWTVEIHSGQALFHDVARTMSNAGFRFMTYELAGLVMQETFHARLSAVGLDSWQVPMRHQVSSLELLYFRDSADYVDEADSVYRVAKAAAVADLYGYPDVACELLQIAATRWPAEAGRCETLIDVIVTRRVDAARRATPQNRAQLLPRLHV